MQESMNALVERSFGFYLRIMQVLGYYPPEKKTKLYTVYAYFVYCFGVVPIPILATVNLLLSENIDLNKISENAFIMFQMYGFIFKLLPFIVRTDAVRRSIYLIESPIFTDYRQDQENIMDECVKTCRRNCLIFLAFVAYAFVSWAFGPLFETQLRLPIDIWVPCPFRSDRKKLLMVYSYVVIGSGNGAFAIAVLDPLLSGLLCHATFQLRILKDNLQFLREHAEEEAKAKYIGNGVEGFKNAYIYEKIARCVRHHETVLEFVANFEDLYSSVVFSQFMASITVVCISCLQLTMLEPFTFLFFTMVSFLITMLIELYFYCYYGTVLFEEGNSVTESAYTGKWYEYEGKSKKALIILMERTKKSIIVTAGKILDLSLETFTTILRRAYSLLAVLQNY